MVVVNYSVTDGFASTPAQAVFHVTGANEAPVVAVAGGVVGDVPLALVEGPMGEERVARLTLDGLCGGRRDECAQLRASLSRTAPEAE